MLLELFSFVNFNNAMAFVYAYIQCLDGPVNWFFLTFCILILVFLLLTVTLQGYHCIFFIQTAVLCFRFLHKSPEDPTEVPGGFLTDINTVSGRYLMSHDARKPVFGVSNQVLPKPGCTVTEDG